MDAYDCAFSQVASARDVSMEGARLEGMRCRLRPGELIEMQYADRKAQFRVVWVSESPDRQHSQVGVRILPSENSIWDLDPVHCCAFVGNG